MTYIGHLGAGIAIPAAFLIFWCLPYHYLVKGVKQQVLAHRGLPRNEMFPQKKPKMFLPWLATLFLHSILAFVFFFLLGAAKKEDFSNLQSVICIFSIALLVPQLLTVLGIARSTWSDFEVWNPAKVWFSILGWHGMILLLMNLSLLVMDPLWIVKCLWNVPPISPHRGWQ